MRSPPAADAGRIRPESAGEAGHRVPSSAMFHRAKIGSALLVAAVLPGFATAQEKAPASDDSLLTSLRYRLVGPFRGGRSAGVAGVPGKPQLFYFGSTGGGVWRTTDGGSSWENISDGFFGGSIGAVAVCESDPNNPRILYASTWRVKRTPYSLESGGPGSGLWKSTDSGDTWKEITKSPGLPQGAVGIIGVAVSPVNSDRVWAIIEAEDGGVFRSDNAGRTWAKVNDDRSLRQRAWYYTRIYAHPKNADEVFVVNVALHKSSDGGKTFTTMLRTPHGDHHDLWLDPT